MKHNKTERQARIDEIRSMHMRNNSDNDWFFDQFDRNFDKVAKTGAKGFLGLGCLAILLNLLFWGALIVLGAWAIGHFIL